jgi:hypothetical protein
MKAVSICQFMMLFVYGQSGKSPAVQSWQKGFVCCVRQYLFGRLCKQIAQHGPVVLEWLYHQPQDTEALFYKRAQWRPQWQLWQEF